MLNIMYHVDCGAMLQVDKAFSTFDTNSDGKLNYKEFCIMVTTKEQERWAQKSSILGLE